MDEQTKRLSENLVSLKQAGEMLNITRNTVFTWIKVGKIDGTLISGTFWAVSKADVIRLLHDTVPVPPTDS